MYWNWQTGKKTDMQRLQRSSENALSIISSLSMNIIVRLKKIWRVLIEKNRKAIIPAAGLGTRFLPATKAMPKEMLPIVDKPTIQYIVEEAVASGIEDIIIVTGKGKRAIEDHFDIAYELEQNLKGKRQSLICWKKSSIRPIWRIFIIFGKNSLWSRSCGMVCTEFHWG